MKCFACHSFSIGVFCKKCQNSILMPSPTMRTIGTLDVVSFYKYSTVENILLSKHTTHGYRIFKALAKLTYKPFIAEFIKNDSREVQVIGVDEFVKNGYSHIALLTDAMKTKSVSVKHSSLMAKNRVTYAGKSLQFRLENPRDFSYRGPKKVDAILVDDIVTTGSTLQQAQSILTKHDVNVLFAITLADANEQ